MPALIRTLVLLWSVSVGPALAAPVPERAGEGAVREVVDGDTVVLAAPVLGASQVRLVGLQAPKLALNRPDFPAWPLAEDAKRALEGLALGKRLALSFAGARQDRYGRLLAHLHDAGGLWIQGEMLRLGMARVYTFADNRALAAEMLAIEGTARSARLGIWGHPFYAVRTPRTVARDLDSFQLVEGAVVTAARARGRIYLNFGEDWRSDFTVSLDGAAQRLFRAAGVDALALEGRRVRVRGWVRRFNGPLIEATHPEQIEVLEDARPPRP